MSTNYKVSSDVDALLKSTTQHSMRSSMGAASQSQVTSISSTVSDHTTDIDSNYNSILTVTSDMEDLGVQMLDKADKFNPTFTGTTTAPKIVTNEIQCEGTTTGTAQPINYDAKEHRFRDFDGSTEGPKDMLVVQKFDGYTGARIGINKDPSSSNAVALHVVAGKNNSNNEEDLGIKVVGGAFFEDFVRVGHYESNNSSGEDTRPTSPSNGTIIYDATTHTFQGYVGGGAGWKTFNMT